MLQRLSSIGALQYTKLPLQTFTVVPFSISLGFRSSNQIPISNDEKSSGNGLILNQSLTEHSLQLEHKASRRLGIDFLFNFVMDFDPWEDYDIPVGDSSEEESENSDGSSEEKECRIPGYWFSIEERNWLELPPEVMSLIFIKVGVIDILLVLQSVCSAWRELAKEPQLFRSINMYYRWDLFLDEEHDMMKIAREAVNRSCGQLVEFSVQKVATDELLEYITEKNSPLRRLRFASCYDISDEGLTDMAEKLPLLEELEFCFCSITEEVFETFGRSCPLLKSFRLNNKGYKGPPSMESDEAALVIGYSMLELRHLNLFGNLLTDNGLQAILDGCPHLSYLDLRQCFNLTFAGGLLKKCEDRNIKVRLPDDSTDDYEYDATIGSFEPFFGI